MHHRIIKNLMILNAKLVPQARFIMTQNVPQTRLIKPNLPQARFFDSILMGSLVCPIHIVYNLLFTHQSSESSFFLS